MSLRDRQSSFRWLAIFTLCAALLLPAGVAAQVATPAATPESVPEITVPTGISVDLAAMNLLPQEMDPAFTGIGDMLVDVNGLVALSRDVAAADLRQTLEDAGLIGEHLIYGAEMIDDMSYSRAGLSSVGEYADAAGASIRLNSLSDPSIYSDFQVIPDAPVIGDEAVLLSRTLVDPNIEGPYEALDYSFRTGNLVGGITLYSLDGSPLDQAIVLELAQTLLDRIDDVRANGSPGLMVPALRVTSGSGFITGDAYEGYLLIDGRLAHPWSETADMFDRRQARWADTNLEAAYITESYLLPAGETDFNQSLTVIVQVFEFPTAEDAAAFAENSASMMVAEATTFTSLEELATLPGISGSASGVSFSYDLGDETVTSGAIYWVQTDTYVVSVQADIIGGVADDGMLTLVDAQIECLATPTAPCAPLSLPEVFAR